uniref:WW domain-containing protein n=1 Tax=Phaeomonas parva TaxID=124430 RepID=A0A7S1XMG0_9STRA|mmetsp:Transcript_21807/g.66843  ORF Transcript_21807/g.66843 Transcript_21807/m.66843 type:complete len:721 (+) Transcript_21807:394-2556(+)|eukprot:CAMPEP_0118857240 /NCGR_PEP_ID=MMETSP1163-20130328/4424_1 /TAXON_ID=124430 /ORGANISM="Phaeomonas parva, Strain CCMP2877" /LENGTH=720 /DNA_ID=CAMNT_0006790519 /DNA_START=299 /DNA_END=2461 /DNA_ORIENTATION=-
MDLSVVGPSPMEDPVALGLTPLHRAARDGHGDVVRDLLMQGADSNALDKHGNTPLHLAAERGHLKVMQYLTIGVAKTVRIDAAAAPKAPASTGSGLSSEEGSAVRSVEEKSEKERPQSLSLPRDHRSFRRRPSFDRVSSGDDDDRVPAQLMLKLTAGESSDMYYSSDSEIGDAMAPSLRSIRSSSHPSAPSTPLGQTFIDDGAPSLSHHFLKRIGDMHASEMPKRSPAFVLSSDQHSMGWGSGSEAGNSLYVSEGRSEVPEDAQSGCALTSPTHSNRQSPTPDPIYPTGAAAGLHLQQLREASASRAAAIAESDAHTVAPDDPDDEDGSEWVEYWTTDDAGESYPYYYNLRTGESEWTPPESWVRQQAAAAAEQQAADGAPDAAAAAPRGVYHRYQDYTHYDAGHENGGSARASGMGDSGEFAHDFYSAAGSMAPGGGSVAESEVGHLPAPPGVAYHSAPLPRPSISTASHVLAVEPPKPPPSLSPVSPAFFSPRNFDADYNSQEESHTTSEKSLSSPDNVHRMNAHSLMSQAFDANASMDMKIAALMVSAANGDASVTHHLLCEGVPPSAVDGRLRTALHYAASRCCVDASAALCEAGAEVDAADVAGDTPLHLSARRGALGTLQVLLQTAARTDLRNQRGDTPLHDAVKHGHTECTELLLEYGAEPNALNRQGDDPVAAALRSNTGGIEVKVHGEVRKLNALPTGVIAAVEVVMRHLA